MDKTELNQKTGSNLSEIAINTILTMVVRLRQPMFVQLLSKREYSIVWNRNYNEPELIEPDKSTTTVRGMVQIMHWLESQTAIIDWYAETKQNEQPNK